MKPEEIYFRCERRIGAERLKIPYLEVLRAINDDRFNDAIEILNYFIEKCSDEVSMMRLLLDAVQTVRDEELFIPIRTKLINIIESKIGKIN